MDTFPIVKRKDEAAHGEYRTKRVILEIYDAMHEAGKFELLNVVEVDGRWHYTFSGAAMLAWRVRRPNVQ